MMANSSVGVSRQLDVVQAVPAVRGQIFASLKRNGAVDSTPAEPSNHVRFLNRHMNRELRLAERFRRVSRYICKPINHIGRERRAARSCPVL
jgi:hypothetical protein